MDDRLFQVILAIIPILCTILTVYIIPLIKEKIGKDNLAKYEYWINIAVRAADMIWKETGRGEDKKQYVISFIKRMFNVKKIIITDEQLDVLIEAAVKNMKIEEK